MKQLLQNYRSGEITVDEVPPPALRDGGVLVRTRYSLISVGTERATVQVAQQNLVGKARSRPDLVKKVFETMQRTGVRKTLEIVRNRLDTPSAMGYSLAGEVLEVGREGPNLQPGARVACAGVGYASHAEVAWVPRLLCVPVPDEVSLTDAAYGALGSIALHGVRQADVGLGDHVGVIGLGLVGQLTARILQAAGCRVCGIDIAAEAVERARNAGTPALRRDAPGLQAHIAELTDGHGLDAVLVTAATDSSDPFDLACQLLRDRGRVVILGNVRVEIPKPLHSELFRKEIDIRVGRSYGPGRYDPTYEQQGQDYPYGYVRWTEQRNIGAFLQLLADKKLAIADLTTHTFPIEHAKEAYDLITGEDEAARSCVGVLLSYAAAEPPRPAPNMQPPEGTLATTETKIGLGIIGAGNFGQANILPHLQDAPVRLVGITTARGYTAEHVARKFDIETVSGDTGTLLRDDRIDAVYILTRHATHAPLTVQALREGKSVYVEKPLALNETELAQIVKALREQPACHLMVGYNRRFAPSAVALRQALGTSGGPLMLNYRVNAGPLAPDSWYLDPAEGGRFIGEGGHFIDLCQFLVAHPIEWVQAGYAPVPGRSPLQQDNLSLQVGFADGSCATILYVSSGDAGLAKERLEVFGRGISAVLDDFRKLTLYRAGNKQVVGGSIWGGTADKGYEAEQRACVAALRGTAAVPISLTSLVETSLATFAVIDALRTGTRVAVDADAFLERAADIDVV